MCAIAGTATATDKEAARRVSIEYFSWIYLLTFVIATHSASVIGWIQYAWTGAADRTPSMAGLS